MKVKSIVIPALVSLVSCTSVIEVGVPAEDKSTLEDVQHEEIVLGEKLDDPYSLENMQSALLSVYPTKADRNVLKATDIYARFLPKNNDDYDRLVSLGLKLVDHPLDYKIVRDGDYYHDPSVDEDMITWQYAVVSSEFKFPKDIPYEILESCYIPDTDGVTRADDIDWALVEREAYRLSGNGDLMPATKNDGEYASPAGRITIIDGSFDDAQPIGVSGVMVAVNSFVKFSTAYTDDEGYYQIPKTYSSDVRYRLVFRNEKGFAIGLNKVLVPASTSALGLNAASGIDVEITSGSERKLFSRCVVNNAARDYFEKCSNESMPIKTPPQNVRMWLFQNLASSSAPMLQQGVILDMESISSFLGVYKDIVQIFMPDITLGLKNCPDYSSIYSSAQHELAHASHFMKAGKDYWNKYVDYILKSFLTSGGNMYGSGGTENSGYCEIGEMWAYYLENELYRDRYGVKCPNYSTTRWFSPQILQNLDERGVNRSMIYQALDSQSCTLDALKSKLIELYPDNMNMIEQVFNRYSN